MLGTPNQGSPCADYMNGAFDLLGKKVEAVRQLRQDVATEFNKYTTNRKGVKFSALAGEVLPTICYANEWNDGVVTVPSAIYNVADNAKSKNVHTDLTGTVDFSGFVKPRLAIGPKGNHNPEAPTMATGMADVKSNSKRFYGASEATDPFALLTPPPTVSWAKEATIAAKQSIEIDVPVTAGPNFGAVFMAPSDISITVIDNTGRVVGTNAAGSPESRAWFRSIFVNNPVTSATWKIRLENTSERELSVIAATGR
jgi:hypothetical protein